MEKNKLRKTEIVLIGGSAGSLDIILSVLPKLDKHLSVPIVIILHRKSSQESTLVNLLSSRTQLNVKEAEEKEEIVGGTIYVAPADYHLLIEEDRTFSLDFSEKILYSRPAIDVTFQTAAYVYKSGVAAILLSGANADGSEGLSIVQQCGGFTLIQHPDDAEISYMPQQALLKIKPDLIINRDKLSGFINGL